MKKIVIFILFCISLNAQVSVNNENAWKKLDKYIYEDKTVMLISHMDKLIKTYPNNKYAHFYRGWTNMVKRDYNEAFLDFSKAISLDQNFSKAYAFKGYLLAFKLRECNESMEFLDKAIELGTIEIYPHKKDEVRNLYYIKADCYNNMGNYELAMENINKAIKLFNQNSYTNSLYYRLRADINFKMKKYDEAYKDIKEALNYATMLEKHKYYQDLANILFYQGNVADSYTYYQLAVLQNSDKSSKSFAQELLNLGIVKWIMGDKESAKMDIKEAFEVDWHNADIPFALGYMEHNYNEKDKAKIHFNIAKGLNPKILDEKRAKILSIPTTNDNLKAYFEGEISVAVEYVF